MLRLDWMYFFLVDLARKIEAFDLFTEELLFVVIVRFILEATQIIFLNIWHTLNGRSYFLIALEVIFLLFLKSEDYIFM